MDSTPFSSLPFQIRPQVLGDATASELAITIYFAKDRSWPAMPPATTVPAGPNAVMTAPAGTTGTDGILRVDIESPPDGNGQTTILSGSVPLQPDGSVNLRLDQVSQELRNALWSGGKIIVTYPLATGGSAAAAVTIPEREITGDLYLRIHGGALWIAAVRRESPPGSGSYTGFGGPGQQGVWTPPRFTLYDAMRRDASIAPEIGAAEVNCALGFEFSIDAFRQVFSSDILYYTLSASSIDPGASISVTMDSALQVMPVAVEGSAAPNSISQQPSIRLVKRESEFDPWFGVGITLAPTPDGPHPRVIEVVPSGGLEPGATYELRLENMIGVHISDSAPRRVVAGRFTVRASEILSDVPYAAMYDMVRRGNLLYVAAGEAVDSADPGGQTSRGFFDILDMSDPSSPLRLSQGEPCDPATQNCASGSCCPQSTLGWARGVAIAENLCSNCGVPSQNDPAPEDAELHTTAAVVGGGGAASGFVALFKADYIGPEETDPPIVPGSDPPVTAFEPVPREEPKVGSYLGGTMVSWPIGSVDRYPVGVPQAVKVTNGLVGPDGKIVVEETTDDDGILSRKRVSPPRAFVSTLGAGLVQVNLDRVGPDNTRATEFILPSFQVPYTGRGGITVSGGTGGETDSGGLWPAWPHDISSAVRGMGMFTYNMGPYLNPPVPTDTRSFLLAAVDHLGLVAWDVTRQTQLGPTPVGIGPFMKAPASPWLEHKAAAPGWADPDDAVASGDLTGGNGFWAPARDTRTPPDGFLVGRSVSQGQQTYHVAPVPTGAMRVQVYPGYNCLDARGEEYQTTIALVAGGQAGVLVYEVYPENAVYPQGNDPVRDPDDAGLAPARGPFMELRAIIPVSWTNTRDPGDTHAGNAYDVVLDTRRRLAYVADFSDSVVVLDMKEPFRTPAALMASGYCHGAISSLVEGFFTDHPPYECISRLDKDGDGKDDRIAGTIPLCPQPGSGCTSRSTLILDSDTGLLYVGASGPIDTDPSTSGGGLKTVGANEPRMEFLLDDTAHPGQLKAPGYLSAFDGDKPRLGMWVQGGVGAVNAFTGRGEISAGINLIDRLGFWETEQVIGLDTDGGDILAPSSTVTRQVTLTRQSLKKTDPKYNFFLQEWNAPGTQVPDPNQKVQLAMMYSQTDPNTPADPAFTPAWLMTSKQSGSIRGSVFLGDASTVPAYLRNRTMTKETKVARPWVDGKVITEHSQEMLARCESAQQEAAVSLDNYTFSVGDICDILLDYTDEGSKPRILRPTLEGQGQGTFSPAEIHVNGSQQIVVHYESRVASSVTGNDRLIIWIGDDQPVSSRTHEQTGAAKPSVNYQVDQMSVEIRSISYESAFRTNDGNDLLRRDNGDGKVDVVGNAIVPPEYYYDSSMAQAKAEPCLQQTDATLQMKMTVNVKPTGKKFTLDTRNSAFPYLQFLSATNTATGNDQIIMADGQANVLNSKGKFPMDPLYKEFASGDSRVRWIFKPEKGQESYYRTSATFITTEQRPRDDYLLDNNFATDSPPLPFPPDAATFPANPALAALIHSTFIGTSPLTVSFRCSPHFGTPPYQYLWKFGDAVTSNEQNPSHTYSVTEHTLFQVELSVTDSGGREQKDLHLFVSVKRPYAQESLGNGITAARLKYVIDLWNNPPGQEDTNRVDSVLRQLSVFPGYAVPPGQPLNWQSMPYAPWNFLQMAVDARASGDSLPGDCGTLASLGSAALSALGIQCSSRFAFPDGLTPQDPEQYARKDNSRYQIKNHFRIPGLIADATGLLSYASCDENRCEGNMYEGFLTVEDSKYPPFVVYTIYPYWKYTPSQSEQNGDYYTKVVNSFISPSHFYWGDIRDPYMQKKATRD